MKTIGLYIFKPIALFSLVLVLTSCTKDLEISSGSKASNKNGAVEYSFAFSSVEDGELSDQSSDWKVLDGPVIPE